MKTVEKSVTQAAKAMAKNEPGTGDEGMARPVWIEGLLEKPRRFAKFLREVRVEMDHVTWPTFSDVRSTTLVVVVTVFFFGLFLFIVDFGVSRLVELILKQVKP